MVKVSVVIPVYNTEEYLGQCLESVMRQTLEDIEIICIDDGSTDSSLAIMQGCAERDPRIRIIRKENGGLVSARKVGVAAAKGEYIGYVDSDDWIEPDMYEELYRFAVRDQADMVCSGYFFEGNYITTHFDNVPEGVYDLERMEGLRENAIYNIEERDVGIRSALWCKLFLAEKFRGIQLGIPEGISISEDKVCILSYLLYCSRVSVRREAFYHYRIRQGSMINAPDPGYLVKVNEVYQYLMGLYEHPLFTKGMRLQAELYITEMLYKGINSRLGFENRDLFWVDPYWLNGIPHGSKVALYGAGGLGHAYKRQLGSRGDLTYAGCTDFGWEKFKGGPMEVIPPEDLPQTGYDVLVITIKNPGKAQEVRRQLEGIGIPGHKILWFEQKEIYWKYAEVNGWIK